MRDGFRQVLIVGGGPVGLAAAIELATHGVASTVVESREAVSWQRPRAKTTSARTMEHFRRWGLAGAVRERAPLPQSWSDQVVFCTTLLGREVVRFDRCFGLDLRHDDLAAEGGQQVAQPVIEQVLREAAERSPLITLATNATVTALTQDATGVRAEVRDAGGTRQIRAGYALGCDGARSMVREEIGVRLVGSEDARANYNMVFRAPSLAALLSHGNAVQYWALNPKQPGVLGRLDLGETWWCIAVGVSADAGAADPVGLIRSLIGDADARVPVEVIAGDPWRARMQLAEHYRVGRVFLAGDAAHLNPPWGGHGFNTGVGDAVNIGWKLAAVLNGWAPAALLDSYEAERRPVAAATISAARRNMSTLAGELADPRLVGTEAEFAAALPEARAAILRTKDSEFHSLGLVLGTAYPDSPVVAAEPAQLAQRCDPRHDDQHTYRPTSAPGHRLPHVWLSDTESLYDRLGPDFTILGELDAQGAGALTDGAREWGIPLRRTAFPAARDLFGAAVVLVRPDQHVAWRGTDLADPAALWRRVLGRG